MASEKRESIIELLPDAEWFFSPDGKPYVTVTVTDHRETYQVRSKAFRVYLQSRYYLAYQHALNSHKLQDALGVLEGKSLFEGKQRAVYYRVGEFEHNIYIDLGGPRWEAIEITHDGWRITTNPPVKFRRSRGMLEIPLPVRAPGADAMYRGLI